VFRRGDTSIELVSFLGPLTFRTCGHYTTLPSVPPSGRAIRFAFDRMLINLAGFTVRDAAFAGKEKTYSFFAEDAGVLTVRSSGGGLTMFVAKGHMPQQRRNIDFLAIEL
jgi:hypothetical protein